MAPLPNLRSASQAGGRDFAQAYDDHVWQVYAFVAYRVGSRSDAEDLTQQTFERALRAWSSFDPSRALVGTWLIAIARNLLIDHFRKDRSGTHEPIGADGLAEERLPRQEAHINLGLEPALAAALETLTEREREIIALRFGGDLSGREIAEITDLSLTNVQQILSRSLRKLRAQLEEPAEAEAT